MADFIEGLLMLLGVVAIIVVGGLLLALPVWLLWNYCLVGAITGVNEITWLQAWGINVLSGCLFKTTINKKT